MDLLNTAAACLLFVTAQPHCDTMPPVHARAIHSETRHRIGQWKDFITEASQRFTVPEDWIRSVINAESGGRTMRGGKPITSSKGAMGLMQLMPETWQEMRLRYGLGNDPYDPHDNILAGTAYLRALLDRFGKGAFAAYNAGPGRFTAYLDGSKPLPDETQTYLRRIEIGAPGAAISHARDTLFFVNSAAPNAPSVTPNSVHPHGNITGTSGDLFISVSRGTP